MSLISRLTKLSGNKCVPFCFYFLKVYCGGMKPFLSEFFMSYFISPRVLSMNVSLFKAILTCYLIIF